MIKKIVFALGLGLVVAVFLELLLRVVFFDAPQLRYEAPAEVAVSTNVFHLGFGPPGATKVQGVNVRKYLNKAWFSPAMASNEFLLRYFQQDLGYVIHYNNAGYRNAFDIEIPKPAACYRMLVLGDSFAFGDVVSDFDTLPFWLNYFLNQHASSNAFVEALNSGYPSSTINLQRRIFKERGRQVEPDMVVLVVCGNDIQELDSRYSHVMVDLPPPPAAPAIGPRHWTSLKNLAKRSVLARALNWMRRQGLIWRDNRAAAKALEQYKEYLAQPRAHAELRAAYLQELSAFVQEVQADGLPLLVVLYGTDDADASAIKEGCAQSHTPVIDLQAVFAVLGDSQTIQETAYLHPYNYHPSRHGNYLAAKAVVAFMEEQDWPVVQHLRRGQAGVAQ